MLGTLVSADARLLVIENGAYGRRMLEIARALGLRAVALSSPPTEPVDIEDVRRALGREDSITHAAVVHCETTSGVLNPLPAIAKIVHEAGCTLLVDAMSSFGAVPIDVVADHVDALAASSNKCLEGVPGLGFVIARTALLEAAPAARSVSLDLAAQWRGLESDGQFRFTPPTHVVLALHEALIEHQREGGVAGRGARYRANHERLVDGMRRIGFREVVTREHQSDVITSFHYPDDPSFVFDDFYQGLRERNVVIYPGKLLDTKCFRIGTIGRVYPEDIDALVGAIREVLTANRTARGAEPAA
jgi:2-aminoethylphosphonate-pyruvate transaminase